ncbi:hypothetical protein DFH28DRAFT_925519 [Melampsora americana]|nr:hypothetical protein DFH28DRAFT_925519 [Melampsora americana]
MFVSGGIIVPENPSESWLHFVRSPSHATASYRERWAISHSEKSGGELDGSAPGFIPAENGVHSISAQFARRSLFTAHLAVESTYESKNVAPVLPTMLKTDSFPSYSPLKYKGFSRGKNKIALVEGDSFSQWSHEGSLSGEQLKKSGASTISIGEKGQKLDEVNDSWWKSHLPEILKSWWKTIINKFSSLSKSIKRNLSKIVSSRSYTVLSKFSSTHVVSPSDRSIVNQGTELHDESISAQVPRIPHVPIDDSATTIPRQTSVEEVTKPPHESTVHQAINTPLHTTPDQGTKILHKSTADEVTKTPHESTVHQVTRTPSDTMPDQGTKFSTKSTADEVTKAPHESIPDPLKSIPDPLTTNTHDPVANQASKIPHGPLDEDDDVFHDALSDLQDHPPDEHETSLRTEPEPRLKENRIPAASQVSLQGGHVENLSSSIVIWTELIKFDLVRVEKISPEESQVVPKENHVPTTAQAAPKAKLAPEEAQVVPKDKPAAEGTAALKENHVPTKAQAALKANISPEKTQVVPKDNPTVEEKAASIENHVPTQGQAARQENHSPTVSQASIAGDPIEYLPSSTGIHPPKADLFSAIPEPSITALTAKAISKIPEPSSNAFSAKPLPATTEASSTARASNPSTAATKSSTTHPEPIKNAVDQVYRPTFRETALQQTKLLIAELSWKMMQRGERWDTVLDQVYPGKLYGFLSAPTRKALQKELDNWEFIYQRQGRTNGGIKLQDHQTLRQALDNPQDEAARKGYDYLLEFLGEKMDNPWVKRFSTMKSIEKLKDNSLQLLTKWEKNL